MESVQYCLKNVWNLKIMDVQARGILLGKTYFDSLIQAQKA